MAGRSLSSLRPRVETALNSDSEATVQFMNAYASYTAGISIHELNRRCGERCGEGSPEHHIPEILRPDFECSLPVALATHACVASATGREHSKSNLKDDKAGIASRAGILLGIIRSNEKGALFLSAPASSVEQPIEASAALLVIAPPPPPSYFDATVWCKDWRRVPPPPPSRNVTSSCPGIFEVLLTDLCVLRWRAPSRPARFQSVTSLQPNPRGLINIYGYIRCKSPILAGRRSRPAFLVELGSDSGSSDIGTERNEEGGTRGLFVAFLGRDAMRWWPFVCPGRFVSLGALQLVSLPKKGNRKVLGACTSKFAVFDGPLPPCSSRSVETGSASYLPRGNFPSLGVQSSWSQIESRGGLVSYSGVITKVMQDGRFELDSSLMLHLGAYCGWCAGPEETSTCFRVGAHVRVHCASVGFRRERPVALFTTARSVAFLEYFGSLPNGFKSGATLDKLAQTENFRTPRDSPWRLHWKELRPSEIVWAEELYTSLAEKFGPWFVDEYGLAVEDAPSTESQWTDVLLGLPQDIERGLVRQVMRMEGVSGVKTKLGCRDVYDEFMDPTGTAVKDVAPFVARKYPSLPSVLKIAHAFDMLFARSGLPSHRRHFTGSARDAVAYQLFSTSDVDIGNLLVGKDRIAGTEQAVESSRKRVRFVGIAPNSEEPVFTKDGVGRLSSGGVLLGHSHAVRYSASGTLPFDRRVSRLHSDWVRAYSSCVSLVGVLESGEDSQGKLCIFDVSASLDTLVVGPIRPDMIGAIVRVSQFLMFVVEHPVMQFVRFAVFDASSLEIVLPGPYAACTSNDYGEGANAISLPRSTRFDSRLIVSRTSGSVSLTPTLAEDVDSRPIVALYVTDFTVAGRCSSGESAFCVHGRLLAFKATRQTRRWVALGDDEAGFLDCALILSGVGVVSLRYALQINNVYAISCTTIPSGVDVRKWVWGMLDGPTCPKPTSSNHRDQGEGRPAGCFSISDRELPSLHRSPEGICLASYDGESRLWLEELSCGGAEICFEHGSLAGGEESVIEAAVRSWQRDPSSAESAPCRQVDFVQLLETRGKDDPSSVPRATERSLLCDKFPWADHSHHDDVSDEPKETEISFVSFACVVISLQGGRGSDESIPSETSVCVRSIEFPLLRLELRADPEVLLPSCIAPGIPLLFRRIRLSNSNEGSSMLPRAQYALSRASSVRILAASVKSLLGRDWASLCCVRPLNIDAMLRRIPEKLIWHYSDACRLQPKASRPGYGCLRVAMVGVKYVHLSRRPRSFGEPVCPLCGNDDFVVDAVMEASISDGTGRATLSAHGFTNVLDVLCGSVRERLYILEAVLSCGDMKYASSSSFDPKGGQAVWTSFMSPQVGAQNSLNLLARRASRNLVAVVIPQLHGGAKKAAVMTMDVAVNFGHGRKLATAALPEIYSPQLECIVALEDGAWNGPAIEDCGVLPVHSFVEKHPFGPSAPSGGADTCTGDSQIFW